MSPEREMGDDGSTGRRAMALGGTASRVVASVLDALEDAGLRALEQAAEAEVASEQLRLAEKRLRALRRLAAPLPRLTGQAVAGSSYFVTRWTPEAVRSAGEILEETMRFLGRRPEDQEG